MSQYIRQLYQCFKVISSSLNSFLIENILFMNEKYNGTLKEQYTVNGLAKWLVLSLQPAGISNTSNSNWKLLDFFLFCTKCILYIFFQYLWKPLFVNSSVRVFLCLSSIVYLLHFSLFQSYNHYSHANIIYDPVIL